MFYIGAVIFLIAVILILSIFMYDVLYLCKEEHISFVITFVLFFLFAAVFVFHISSPAFVTLQNQTFNFFLIYIVIFLVHFVCLLLFKNFVEVRPSVSILSFFVLLILIFGLFNYNTINNIVNIDDAILQTQEEIKQTKYCINYQESTTWYVDSYELVDETISFVDEMTQEKIILPFSATKIIKNKNVGNTELKEKLLSDLVILENQKNEWKEKLIILPKILF